jgi:exodeoxyribonuclease VII large subunit
MVTARPRATPAPLTVTQLTALVRDTLEQGVGRVLVAGEISNLRAAPSGHVYFTLKDDRSQLRCVMFRSVVQLLVFSPADGQEVVVRGQVSLYPSRGEMQLYVDALEPQGRGALQLAFEQLKERLGAEGLFDEARKRPLPFFPRHVGVATALGGAALHDILVILRARCPGVHVVVRSVRVQGAGAADDIVAALADLNERPDLQVLIVGRGGGSLEDLWPFNEEKVARAIATSRVPVISAVGHEVDVTIADLVADRRAPTPTAAAEIAVPRAADLGATVARLTVTLAAGLDRRAGGARRRLDDLAGRLRDPRRRVEALRARLDALAERSTHAVGRRVSLATATVDATARRLVLRDPRVRGAALATAVAACRRRLELAARHVASAARERVARAAATLDGLSPLGALQRGYSLTRRLPERALVRDAAVLAPGDRLEITFAAGTAVARVEPPSGRRRS